MSARQAFYDWRKQQTSGPTAAENHEAELVQVMREIHDEFDETYGSPRITVELGNRGWQVNHKRVERLMANTGLLGCMDQPR